MSNFTYWWRFLVLGALGLIGLLFAMFLIGFAYSYYMDGEQSQVTQSFCEDMNTMGVDYGIHYLGQHDGERGI